MYDTLSETEGCDLLARLFSKRGYQIKRNVQFREYGVEFHVDGWDARARVGFEFLTSEDDDHDDLTLEEYNALTAAQRRGELALFIIDEVEPVSAEALAAEAHEFLDEVADAAHARLKAAARRAKAARARPAARAAAAKRPAVGKAGKGTASRKPAKRTPAGTGKARTKASAAAATRKKKVATKKVATRTTAAGKATARKAVKGGRR